MPVDKSIIIEAERLQKKFGSMAADVARELRNVDSLTDHYFWTCVIDYLNDHPAYSPP